MNAERTTRRFSGASNKSCRLSAGNGERVNMLKRLLGFLAYITILAVMAVTAKADATFSGKLSGAQMVPPNTSKALGVGTVILNDAETRITISLDFSGLRSNQTAAHIHGPGGPGSEAPVLFNLGSQGATSGTFINLSAAVSRGQVAQLRAGKWYFDVHSTKLLHGEIRGQILPGANHRLVMLTASACATIVSILTNSRTSQDALLKDTS
jgi:CHRD domain